MNTERVRLLLVHPPLLAPVALTRLGAALGALGHRVAVPDLREAITGGLVDTWWQRAAGAAAAAMPDAQAVVAHSGAGALVPPLLARLAQVGAVVLVDAVLPPAAGVHETSSGVRAMVAGLATGGVLAPWTSWWPPGVLEAEVPDDVERAALAESAPALPLALYDVDVPAPLGWEPASRSYLRLSPGYVAQAQQAAARGWHVEHLGGRHLDALTRARDVAAAIHHLLL